MHPNKAGAFSFGKLATLGIAILLLVAAAWYYHR